jgi:signal peptidase II
MHPTKIFRTLLILILLTANIGCDQISKSLVREKVQYSEHISLVSNYVTLTKIENTGAFLSLGSALPSLARLILLTLLPLAVLLAALIYLLLGKNLSKRKSLSICFLVGGGIGNIFDRVVYGSVTDFLHIDFVIFQTGIFNIADVSIMIGAFTMLCDGCYSRRKEKAIHVNPTEN